MVMLLEFFAWWYGTGWLDTIQRTRRQVERVWRMFSVSILISTLFSPWRRIISLPGKSISEVFRSMIDNLVSRAVGFMVRILVLITAVLLTLLMVIASIIAIVAWPLLPFAVVVCFIKAVMP